MKKNNYLNIPLTLFIVGAIFFYIATIIFLPQQKVNTVPIAAGEACSGGPGDDQGCSNGGNLFNGCFWICNNAPPGVKLVPPPCCEILAQTGDPFACCFDARRRCTPDQCASIPEGVVKQRCAQLWVMGYCNQTTTIPPSPTNSPQPTSPAAPTNPPEVTQPPVIQPTQPPIQPTQPAPTTKPFVQLTPAGVNFQTQQHGNGTTQQEFNLLNFIPKINFPDLKFTPPKINVDELQRGIAKPLDILESIFGRIVYYDRLLESGINEKVRNIFK